MLQEKITLSNGVKIPKLGLGTWFIPDDQAAEAVRQAASMGGILERNIRRWNLLNDFTKSSQKN